MENKTAKQIVSAYRMKFALIIVGYVVAVALLIFLMRFMMLISMLGIMFLAATVRRPFEMLRKHDIDRVIYEELDPEKFGEILALGVLKKSTRHKMLLYMASGQHDEILSFVEKNNPKTPHPIDRCNNLYRQGYVYFERGEYDKLPAIYKKYNRMKSDNPKFTYALNNFSVFDKFDAFADDDFEYVVDVCDIDLKEIDSKKQNHNLTKINVSFYRAVSLYKLERFDEARAAFEEIIAFAPKMYKAKLSKEFIELIDNK